MASEDSAKPRLLHDRDIKYHVTLEGGDSSILPWPSIRTPIAKFVGEELGRVLLPEDADALKKIFEEHYPTFEEHYPDRKGHEVGFVPLHAYYNIFKNSIIANIDDMYKRARPFGPRITDPWYGTRDGYCYLDDKQNRKIDTHNPSDPKDFKPEAEARDGAEAGAGGRAEAGGRAGGRAGAGGSRRSSRKYKKSNRVYRKKSRATKRN